MKKLFVVSMMVVALAMVGLVPGPAIGALYHWEADPSWGKLSFDQNYEFLGTYGDNNELEAIIMNHGGEYKEYFKLEEPDIDSYNRKSDSFTFDLPVAYMALKSATNTAVFYFATPATTVTWLTTQYKDMSHVGGYNAVPIPGAAWLLGSGILGLMALRRRQQKK